MTTLYLVRHGATDAINHTFTGRLRGISLNAEGLQQARRLAERFRNDSLAAVFSSPAERAHQTAEIIAEATGMGPQDHSAFDEIDVGAWSGLSFDTLNRKKEFHLFNSARSLTRPPSGELMLEVQSRAVAELLRIARQIEDRAAVVVSHADVIKAVLAYFIGMPLDLTHRLVIDLASVSVVRLGTSHVQVLRVNS